MFFTESVAASCLAIGLGTRLAATMITVQMFRHHASCSSGRMVTNWTSRGYNAPLLLGVLATAIFFRAAVPHSVDRAIREKF